MPEAYVQRDAGDLQGPDIIDPLMSEVPVLIARGTAAIDRSSDLQKVYVTAKYIPFLRRGMLAEIVDELQGQAYRGKIVGVAYSARGVSITVQLTIQRVAA